MKVKTKDLIGVSLDYAVARAKPDFSYRMFNMVEWPDDEYWVMCRDGVIRHHEEDLLWSGMSRSYHITVWSPSTDPSQGQPIMERERIMSCPRPESAPETGWYASTGALVLTGPTMLIAAMRCYVADKLGDEIDVPARCRA